MSFRCSFSNLLSLRFQNSAQKIYQETLLFLKNLQILCAGSWRMQEVLVQQAQLTAPTAPQHPWTETLYRFTIIYFT